MLERAGVTLDRLLLLSQIAERGGIMAAANGDATRQSLMSRQMSSLEEALRVTLLNRESKPYQLSGDGVRIEGLVRDFAKDFEACVQDLVGGKETLVIGAGESVILWFLIPFFSKKGNVDLGRIRFRNMRSRDAVRAMEAGHIDLAIHHGRDAAEKSVTQGIADIDYRLVAKKGVVKSDAKGKALNWKSLTGGLKVRVAALEGDGGTRRLIDELCERNPNGPQVGMECTSLPQILGACESGEFFGIVPEIARGEGLEFFRLRELKGEKMGLAMSYREKRTETSGVLRAVVRALGAG